MACALSKACSQACSQVITLPSVMAIALSKVTENSLFYLFFTFQIEHAKLIYLKQIIDRAGQGGLSETSFRAGISQMKQRHTLGKATPATAGGR